MDRTMIEELIVKHEGRRAAVYQDTNRNLTIGIGWNLDAPGSDLIASYFGLDIADLRSGSAVLADAQIDEVFQYQLSEAIRGTMLLLPGFGSMPDGVQAAVVDQVFNLGIAGFGEFRNEIAALNRGDWRDAGLAAKSSLWFNQVGQRGTDDVALLEAGQ